MNCCPKIVISMDTPKYGDVLVEIHTDSRKMVNIR